MSFQNQSSIIESVHDSWNDMMINGFGVSNTLNLLDFRSLSSKMDEANILFIISVLHMKLKSRNSL